MACQLRKHHFLAIQSQIALLLKKNNKTALHKALSLDACYYITLFSLFVSD
jgi:hypothetical protein